LAFIRFRALLLLVAILANSAAVGLATINTASATSGSSYHFVPGVPQYSSEAAALNYTIPYPVPRPSPVFGEISVLVIAVEFSDYNHTVSIDQVSNQTIKQLDAYYNTISYGAASVVGRVVGWVRLPYRMGAYGWDNGPFIDDQDGDGYPDSWRILRDVAPLIPQEVDLKAYQQILIFHAGYGQESSRTPNDIWSVTYLHMTVSTSKGVFSQFAVVPESEARGLQTVGVYTHEFGHLLGLPDLYSTSAEQVGPWDLMARGAWNGKPPGSSPSEMIAWDRLFLGWLTSNHVLNITQQIKVNATIDPIELPSSGLQVVKVQTPSLDSKHYYLIETRQKLGYDKALPSSGVLITYIDETRSNPVKVIDAVQTTSTLDDAPFQVGQKYLDGANNLIISISSTNNSSYSITIDTLAPSVDVAVESLTLNPPTVHPNVTASLDVQVANEGTLKAKTFFVAMYLNDTLFASRRISLDPGQSQVISLSWTPKSGGTYFFKVVLDPEKALAENSTGNNVKILRVVVGYTLTLEIRPPSAGDNLQWWLIVNGNNETYAGVGDFQIGVLPGSNTLQIQPLIYLNPSSRFVFRQWSDGSVDNPRTIQVSSDMSLGADFNAQYLLSLDPNGGAASGAGWYDPGTSATVTATSPSSIVTDQSRLVFLGWSGDAQSDSTVLVVNMTRPYSLKANWKTQYYLNVQSPYAAAGAGWYDANAQAVISLNSPVATGNGVRYVFVMWAGDLSGANQSQSIVMTGPKLVSAVWATQYELKMESDYGHTSGAGWYDPGAQAVFGVDTLIIDTANDTRRVFTQWSGDATGSSQQGTVTMDGPKSIRADWRTQYLLAFVTKGIRNGTVLTIVLNSEPHQVKVPETVELWLDAESSVSFSANATASEGFRRYVFQEWRNDTGGAIKSPQSVLKPERYTAVYRELSIFPCIIATVTFGSEVTPEVQFLRNFRDHLVLSTHAGSAFMNVFNSWYYSFSPKVADFIVLHDAMRTPLRIALYPLLGILELSSAAYFELAFMPELAITTAGILASALIGLVYLTPVSVFLVRFMRRKGIGAVHVLRAYSGAFLFAVAALLLGELTASFSLLAVAASVFVLSTLVSTPLLFSFRLMSLQSRLEVLAKMKAILRIQ
jgi:M6 family metalloprotease-like protein